MKALIIDDETDICFVLSTILKQNNISNCWVNKLADAKTVIEKEKPSIIFLDNHLPDGLGMDFTDFIKIKCPDAFIIMITAYDSSEDRHMAEEKGINVFLSKPFTIKSIVDVIKAIN